MSSSILLLLFSVKMCCYSWVDLRVKLKSVIIINTMNNNNLRDTHNTIGLFLSTQPFLSFLFRERCMRCNSKIKRCLKTTDRNRTDNAINQNQQSVKRIVFIGTIVTITIFVRPSSRHRPPLSIDVVQQTYSIPLVACCLNILRRQQVIFGLNIDL